MSRICELISRINGMRAIGGCTKEDVIKAQEEIGMEFPEEYIEYLLNYGAIRFNGVELCGLNVEGYLNVVEATLQERSVNKKFPLEMFVIEDLGIDAKLIVSDSDGNIYLFQRDTKRLICSSFVEYLEKCQYR